MSSSFFLLACAIFGFAIGDYIGPRGMYCTTIAQKSLPKVVMRFNFKRVLATNHTLGDVDLYGMSTSDEYAFAGAVGYTVAQGPSDEVTLASGYSKAFAEKVGLDPPRLEKLNYHAPTSTAKASVQTYTSGKKRLHLSYEGCYQYFLNRPFCGTVEGKNVQLVLTADSSDRGVARTLVISNAGKPDITLDWSFNGNMYPMNITIVKNHERDIAPLREMMPEGTEAGILEGFFLTGQGFVFDLLRDEIILYYGKVIKPTAVTPPSSTSFAPCA